MTYQEIVINNISIRLIPLGLCACGCGKSTKIAQHTDLKKLRIKGQHLRFAKSHGFKNLPTGQMHHNWKGGRWFSSRGYLHIQMPNHPNARKSGYIAEHIYIASNVLGKPIPPQAVVHHHNAEQLIICENQAYHRLLHQRMKALTNCGHASWRKCVYCKKYDSLDNLQKHSRSCFVHRKCKNNSDKVYRNRKKWARGENANA